MDYFWIILGLLVPLGTIAVLCTIELLRLNSHKSRLEARNLKLVDEIEKLDDRVWEMAASEALHRSLVETLGDLVVRRNSAGRILYANDAYAQLIGVTAAAARGASLEPKVVSATLGQSQDDGSHVLDELIRLADGTERWIAWVETPVTLEGDATVRQRVGRDVSGRVAAERLLEEARAKAESASEAKTRFLATVSHEFRTPLNGILGMSDLLNDTRLEPEQVAYVRALQSSGKALLSLVDEILDLTKVEAGRVDFANEPFDPVHLIEDVVELMAPRAQTKGLDIAAFIDPDLPLSYLGDEERIRQILVNLMGNAIKFTQIGGVALYASAIRHNEMLCGLEIRVEDTGAGIASDRLEAIFLEFEQASAETGRLHGGTGLGLAIVKRLSLGMGGDVRVTSQPGHGSIFTVTLPLIAGAVAHNPDEANIRPPMNQDIVIISSSTFSGAAMAGIARSAGASVNLVSGNQGQALVEQSGASARRGMVIIDYALGAKQAEALRVAAINAGYKKVLVALSPQERRVLGRPLDAGFSGHLVKPVRARSLLDRLVPKAPTNSRVAVQTKPENIAGLHVLVAEDNEINALIVLRTLERRGCNAIWARSGREALTLAKAAIHGEAASFDLILMDVRMPEMDGLEATRRIRALELGMGSPTPVPVIGISANVAPEDIAAAHDAGMDDCLPKPMDRERLFDWLAKCTAIKAKQVAA